MLRLAIANPNINYRAKYFFETYTKSLTSPKFSGSKYLLIVTTSFPSKDFNLLGQDVTTVLYHNTSKTSV